MEVIVAGVNVDRSLIDKVRRGESVDDEAWTPETLSASYARISSSPLAITELREQARAEIEQARKSNETIVFGMGHNSIAEHAVFNFDILNVSRLLVEEIERFRLCSFTEKSQRYVLFTDDYVVPEEIAADGYEDDYRTVVNEQFKAYGEIYEALKEYNHKKYAVLAQDRANHPKIDGWAKEDARYVIPLATRTQLGMTLNARNLELMIRRLKASSLGEGRALADHLFRRAHEITPSLILHTRPTKHETESGTWVRRNVESLIARQIVPGDVQTPPALSRGDVTLLEASPSGDVTVVAALMHANSNLSFAACHHIARNIDEENRDLLIRSALSFMRPHDPAPRVFEHVVFRYEVVVSAACYAQLKRHRMATLCPQSYDPDLGVVMPESVRECGMERRFNEVMHLTRQMYDDLCFLAPSAAPYVLTNAHRRRVAVTVNARELYHIARLRMDKHAQWDVRRVCSDMIELAKTAAPATMSLACGKDQFSRLTSGI